MSYISSIVALCDDGTHCAAIVVVCPTAAAAAAPADDDIADDATDVEDVAAEVEDTAADIDADVAAVEDAKVESVTNSAACTTSNTSSTPKISSGV